MTMSTSQRESTFSVLGEEEVDDTDDVSDNQPVAANHLTKCKPYNDITYFFSKKDAEAVVVSSTDSTVSVVCSISQRNRGNTKNSRVKQNDFIFLLLFLLSPFR